VVFWSRLDLNAAQNGGSMAGGRTRDWRRIALWVVAPAVLGVVGILFWHAQQTGPYHVGTCFQTTDDTGVVPAGSLRQVTGRAEPVSCTARHDAKITRAVRNASDCVDEGAWLESVGQLYCVALSD
jgi:hypothetical protein